MNKSQSFSGPVSLGCDVHKYFLFLSFFFFFFSFHYIDETSRLEGAVFE